MFLKRIEMQGFKSFADKTIISFDNPITGVVGPNGCGKSNITDAVRWVLGEQSAKSMRGEKMNDVIFAGSADRRKLNMAEVTLVFDNSNHILNSEKEEIEVTRIFGYWTWKRFLVHYFSGYSRFLCGCKTTRS